MEWWRREWAKKLFVTSAFAYLAEDVKYYLLYFILQ
jgi:hypothetical protein